MIDIGPNLSNHMFDNDIKEVIDNAVANNVKGLILTSTDLKTFYKNIDIIKNNLNENILLKTTLGLHPHNANQHKEFFNKFQSLLNNESICSIGEFGLDYFRMISTKENQILTMNTFLDIANNYQYPLFLHERNSFDDFYSILKNSNNKNKKVVHCFTGSTNELKKYLDIGCYIGITGWITDNKRNQSLSDALKYIPIDRLMIETDSPYLKPRHKDLKNNRNEPANLIYIANYIAQSLNIPLNEIIDLTLKNSIDFFNLKDYNYNNNRKNKI